jgi:hypothetical protein
MSSGRVPDREVAATGTGSVVRALRRLARGPGRERSRGPGLKKAREI